MYSYETVTEALNDLKKRGFAADFNIQSNAIECRELNIQLHPTDFEIVEFYRKILYGKYCCLMQRKSNIPH